MKQDITFRFAVASDADRAMEIIDEAKATMRREGRNQWNESYPTMEHVQGDIKEGTGMVAELNGKVVAYGAIGFSSEPAYNEIKGHWLTTLPYIVLHRLAVADEAKGHGIASLFIEEVARIAKEKGIKSFKVDTNYDNDSMLHVLKKMGFTYCGEIYYQKGSRMAFEKLIQ